MKTDSESNKGRKIAKELRVKGKKQKETQRKRKESFLTAAPWDIIYMIRITIYYK